MNALHIQDSHFEDTQGRRVILNGLNMVCKDPESSYLWPISEKEYIDLAAQGINVLRFGIIWAGVEPTPGCYDEQYLQNIRQHLQWAEKAGIYIFLDFHQDLYGISFSDGAPKWAELTDGLPHITGDLWSDAYLISPAVNCAIEHFWKNTEVDGIGLMDRYLEMLRHTAGFFRDVPNLLGYDVMNEPYPGTLGQAALAAVLEALPGGADAQLKDQSEKAQLISSLNDMSQYRRLTELLGTYTVPWEETVLCQFYSKAAAAIHSEMPEALIFTNPCYFTNLGTPCGLTRLDDNQVLAPHGYDLIVDTGFDALYEPGRIDYIFDQHLKTGQRLNLPVLVGEWGAFDGRPGNDAAAEQMIRILERNFWSHTFWTWSASIEKFPEWNYLHRGYPVKTAGSLESYCWKNNRFQMSYTAAEGETEVYIPDLASKKVAVVSGCACFDKKQDLLVIRAKAGDRISLDVQ